MEFKAVDLYLKELAQGHKPSKGVDDADVADYLEQVKQADERKFLGYLKTLPPPLRAQTVIELPTTFQVDLLSQMAPQELAELIDALESDDATDFAKLIGRVDEALLASVLKRVSSAHQAQLQTLIAYREDEAGAMMQTELFRVCEDETLAEALPRLQTLKKRPGIGRIHFAFVTDRAGKLLRVLGLDDLILEDRSKRFNEIPNGTHPLYSVQPHEPIQRAADIVQKYDLTVLAVVDSQGRLLGRITHDDVVDWVQKKATEQMYKLAHIAPGEELHAPAADTARSRTTWLGVNLIGITVVSIVIGLFEEVLSAIVAIAILMPIVANMAGSASVQTITVAIRQMALGELRYETLWPFIRREILISVGNGVVFGILVGLISQWRFGDLEVSVVIALAMFASLLFAGAIGALVPIWFRKMGFDPAITSSVLIVTFMDVLGFAFFLGLATLWLL